MSDTPNPPQGPVEPTPGSVNPTPAVPGASGTPDAAAGPAVPPAPGMGDPADVEKNKVMALLSYVGILWLVPLLAAKDSPFAKYHCNQGILLSITAFVGIIAVVIVGIVAGFIPFVGWCAGCVVWLAYLAGMLTLTIMGILNALGGKMKPLPMFPAVNWVK